MKNPLEDLREEILNNQAEENIDDFTQMGIAEEVLMLCDALDRYYGIDKSKVKTDSNTFVSDNWMNNLYHEDSFLSRSRNSITYHMLNENIVGRPRQCKSEELVKESSPYLNSIRNKLSKENPLYLQLSSLIASIAVRDVVSTLNNFYSSSSSTGYRNNMGLGGKLFPLLNSAGNVMSVLKGFDMTDECKGNYEENRKRIMEYRQSIEDAVREYSYKSNAKAENSGCMLFFLTIIITFFCFCGVFIYMLQT